MIELSTPPHHVYRLSSVVYRLSSTCASTAQFQQRISCRQLWRIYPERFAAPFVLLKLAPKRLCRHLLLQHRSYCDTKPSPCIASHVWNSYPKRPARLYSRYSSQTTNRRLYPSRYKRLRRRIHFGCFAGSSSGRRVVCSSSTPDSCPRTCSSSCGPSCNPTSTRRPARKLRRISGKAQGLHIHIEEPVVLSFFS